MSYQIYHNPRCRKSREALKILRDNGIEPKISLYLQEPVTVSGLKYLAKMMDKSPDEFIRKGETAYKEFVKGKDLDDESLFEIMTKHPILIERPIVVRSELNGAGKDKAVLGRPPESVLTLLS